MVYVTPKYIPVLNTPMLTENGKAKPLDQLDIQQLEIPSHIKFLCEYIPNYLADKFTVGYFYAGKVWTVSKLVGEEKYLSLPNGDMESMAELVLDVVERFKDTFPDVSPVVYDHFKMELVAAASKLANNNKKLANNNKLQYDSPEPDNDITYASLDLPGMRSLVDCPHCENQSGRTLWSIIQHLNDTAMWTREQIADWVDELHDDGIIDAEFQPWGEVDEGPKEIEGHTNLLSLLDEAAEFSKQKNEYMVGYYSAKVVNPKDFIDINDIGAA